MPEKYLKYRKAWLEYLDKNSPRDIGLRWLDAYKAIKEMEKEMKELQIWECFAFQVYH